MKKTTILLGMLSMGFAYAQSVPTVVGDPNGKVGVNTETPQETLDVKGTLKVQELPTEGVNKIFNGAETKNSPFTPTKTVVADASGVLGTVGFVIPSGTADNTSLKWDDAAKKWVAVVPTETATGPDQNDEAWKKQKTTDRVTNNDDATNIYRSTNVGIGDFSNFSVASPLHIRKSNAASNYVFGTIQITDSTRDNNAIASMFQFLDRNGGRYAMIGDVYQDNNIFEFRGEHGFTTRLSSFEANHQNYNRASIDLKGGGFGRATTNGDIVKIKFNTGQFNNNPQAYGVTSISKHGNWYFGADAGKENTPADQKVVIRGALRFDGSAFAGLTDNAPISDALQGTMFYNNGHFFGVIPNGSNALKWKQLDNVDYTGGRGITVDGTTINLPNGGVAPTGTNKKVLTWNNGNQTWEATEIAATDTNIYTNDGTISSNRRVTLTNNSNITWTGGNVTIAKDGEALTLKPTTTNASSYIRFNNGSNNIGHIGKSSSSNNDLVFVNSTASGNVRLEAGNDGTGELEMKATTVRLTKPPAAGVLTDKVLVRDTNGIVKIVDHERSPWLLAGSLTGATGGTTAGTPANSTHNSRNYARAALADTRAAMFYSGKLGLNVGLTAGEKANMMPAALNISGTGDQLSLQSNSEAWGISAVGNTLSFDFRTVNTTSASTPVKKFGVARNGNVGFGDVTADAFNISLTEGVLYEHNHKKLSILGTAADQVSLHSSRRVRIDEIPEHNTATHILVEGASGVVSKKAISTLTTAAAGPWFRTNGTTQATNADNTDTGKMYYRGAIGIGDFSTNANITLNTNMSEAEKNTEKLVVNGAVLAGKFRGAHGANIFPDYVFQKYYTGTSSIKADYTFQSLSQVEDFVKANGHLPGYKSAADIKAQGYIDVMETQISNVEKIEELYLHTIEQEKALKEKDAKIKALEERLERLEKLIK